MENESKSRTDLLEIKPQNINYGCLSPGQETMVMLNVSGGPGKVTFSSPQLSVSPTSFECGDHKLEITLSGGHSGELMWDEITLVTETQTLTVPVIARWNGIASQILLSENIESATTKHAEEKRGSGEQRTFKGKSCSLCGRNFSYDSGKGTWEQCECNWYHKGVNVSKRIIIDLKSGRKELPIYLKETWRLVIGKEKL